MGIYLNQLPSTEVDCLKNELAETLIANFCYPRFYDYRTGALRMRPVDRAKRQEVWQYLSAVDFNVWGRVDLDTPDFQRQVERLLIHFVQRNRNFFGNQGRKRMTDVRSLITSCSNSLAEGLRGHLQGRQGNTSFGSPRPTLSWAKTNLSGQSEPVWEQILSGTMQLQQQLQEVRGEVRTASAPVLAQSVPPTPSTPVSVSTGRGANVPARRTRTGRSAANGVAANGNGQHEEEVQSWQSQGSRPDDARISASFPGADQVPTSSFSSGAAESSPTMPLPLGKADMPTVFQPAVTPEMSPSPSGRQKRVRPSSPAEAQHQLASNGSHSMQMTPPVTPQLDMALKQAETGSVVVSDEDVVIFEQMRHQLFVWLRVTAVQAGIELGTMGAFQLVDALRHQDGVDVARIQVVSTLLNMCDQIVNGGHATLFDYKQAMMFYLMHTRRAH